MALWMQEKAELGAGLGCPVHSQLALLFFSATETIIGGLKKVILGQKRLML
jgi:hypothetical protein